ncbi:MAG TPA: PH domain-containing protein [Gemmataceae bacterium]|nr:PH domain-containing protein [Gemmataceae bacterium]
MKIALLDGEEVLATEQANHGSGGGWLYVTNRRVIFEPNALSFGSRVREIPLEDIDDVGPHNLLGIIPDGMEIWTRDGKRHRFVVWGRRRLIDMIHVCKSGIVE